MCQLYITLIVCQMLVAIVDPLLFSSPFLVSSLSVLYIYGHRTSIMLRFKTTFNSIVIVIEWYTVHSMWFFTFLCELYC